MKKIFVFSIVAIAFSITACNSSSTSEGKNNSANDSTSFHAVDTTKLKTGDVFYQCEMHPDQVFDKVGTCPKCEMELTKVVKK